MVLDQGHRRLLESGTLGGITLFKDNASSLGQLASLTEDILSSSFHPPVLTVDQEGGAVQRFDGILSPLPSPMALSALNDEELSREATRISAGQLKTLGFNLLLAPTLDLLTNPINPIICTRAFADNVEQVSKMGRIVADEIEKQGLAACTKHFPGHGSTDQDSHLELAIVSKSKSALESFDMAPFKNVPAAAMLIGHIWLPQLIEKSLPASLSSLVVSDILRGELGFEGLIVSDDMTMKAITRAYGLGEACVRAVEAGIDLLLVCGTLKESQEATAALARAIEDGRLTLNRLESSISRLDKLFSGRPEPKLVVAAQESSELPGFAKKIEKESQRSMQISGNAVAVLKGTMSDFDPQEETLILAPAHPRYTLNLVEPLRTLLPNTKISELRYPLDQEQQIENLEELSRGKQIIFLTFRSFIYRSQMSLLKVLTHQTSYSSQSNSGNSSNSSRLIHIACDTPYDIALLEKEIGAGKNNRFLSLCTFDPSDQAMVAVAHVLASQIVPLGKIPCRLPEMTASQ